MNESLDKEVTIITPEQVQLQFQTAGLGTRALAHLIDAVILSIVNTILFVAALGFGRLYAGEWLPDIADYLIVLVIVLFIVINLGYFVCTEAYMGGQTPGKKKIGIRVLQNNGQSATLLSIIIRNLFRLLDMLPSFYFLGALAIFLTARDKRVGDMVAGTIVVIEARSERLKLRRQIDKAISKWKLDIPLIEFDDAAKQAVTSEDWQLLQAWIERIPTMHSSRLQQLAFPIAQHFTRKLGHDVTIQSNPASYLIRIYEHLREDWEI
ncbi:RDD family protein [Paenibacillus sp. SYP-B3998]|uniref:RDD family protein n=1 Tax=Paenibacillus sp. SYP-B3998 TaxID=2678564 RepID=A0A6G4A5J3_9BACL|nr:RDD family protein [Paenibacillus sp. SYP-B3998]NEW09214.1 RDD family protein [Paenibacillus sp. SYP-B3998]